ncbi:MAG: tRNA (adenosine(37)-N6)-dimethylallyltransferase MiaA [Hyphomicrobiaceae bacterium]
MSRPQAILIAGPTASGKSALAVDLAKSVGGVVINADSMQVYRDLSVLTARPQIDEMEGITHELYGFVGAGDAYSVGRYLSDVAVNVGSIHARGEIPIIVGGTGLYFRGLLEGLSPVPPIDPKIRQRWRDLAATEGAAALHAALKVRDSDMAGRLMPTDAQRLVRALEVIESTGRSLSYWQSMPGTPILDAGRCTKVVVTMDRELLYQRCNTRLVQMIEGGALFEVARLQAMQLDRSFPIMRALGVSPLLEYLEGKFDIAEATARAQTETRQYAKRQLTWLRRNMMSWIDINLIDMKRNDALNIILG